MKTREGGLHLRHLSGKESFRGDSDEETGSQG
jgi:hypothetical protein